MPQRLILASGSEIRRTLLCNACVSFDTIPVSVDENAIKDSLIAEGAKPRDVADQLAEQKARRVSAKVADALVIGCDQVLEFDGEILSKAADQAELEQQLNRLNGNRHKLHSAAVIYEGGQPVWRHIGTVSLHMRRSSPEYLADYLGRNWPGVAYAVGGYKLEEEGIRLFHRIDGDYFHVLGLPLLELLSYLAEKGVIPG